MKPTAASESPAFGPYHIPDSKTLIIVDAHDTILQRDLSRSPGDVFGDPRDRERIQWRPREGLLNFIEYYASIKKKRIVISSDGGRQKLRGIFRRFGIDRQLAGVYGGEHLHRESYLKQLDLIMSDLGASPDQAVFIGDSRIDRLSAEKYGVDFIAVPGDQDFSFNAFIRQDFTGDRFGLEIQRLTNLGRVRHNLSSPELVEAALGNGEGRLAHLGPLVVRSDEGAGTHPELYIVREPSSDADVYWEGSFLPYSPARFQRIFLRLQAFLQDRDLFVQDCFAGAELRHRYPLRVITQTAWHSLYARNTFIQARPEELPDFFPEYTVIHVPHFRAIPEVDGTAGESFMILNLARKLALIGGTARAGEIRFAAFNLLGYFFARADVLPLRCSSNHDPDGGLSLFCGRSSLSRSVLALDPERLFFGDAHHCWTDEGFFNLEWGCYEPIAGLRKNDSPALFETTRKFGTILENVDVDASRRLGLGAPGGVQDPNVRASFPITHLEHADRSGRAGQPRHLFILIDDDRGVLPVLAQLTPEQAVLWLLAGYDGARSERPFFLELPALFHPAHYALLFWQKLKASGAQCWLLNTNRRFVRESGDAVDFELTVTPAVTRDLVRAVHAGSFAGRAADDLLEADGCWGFLRARRCPDVDPRFFLPAAERAVAAGTELCAAIRDRLDEHRRWLDPDLLRAYPGGSST